ncbi:hypothetical protein S83_058717, partial [Arachis hypogaea]
FAFQNTRFLLISKMCFWIYNAQRRLIIQLIVALILANSKPCPKYKRPIEKNQECLHMMCSSPCKFEFCWLCLGAWSDHGERTRYDETKRRREMAKNSLERYTHYYERWASNQSARTTLYLSSRQKALADLHWMQIVH